MDANIKCVLVLLNYFCKIVCLHLNSWQLTRERNDSVDLDGRYWFTISSYDCKVVAFNRDLSRTHWSESVDHSESVSPSWGDGKHFQRCVCHETGVGVSELSFAVDQNRFGVLTGVDRQTAWEPLGGIFVEPVTNQHYMSGQVIIIQVAVGVFRRWLTDDDAAVQAVELLQTCVCVPEVCTSVTLPLVSVMRLNW